jgi:hypothetical protein
MKTKYKALRIIGSIFKILGIIFGVITILAMLGACGLSLLGGTALDSIADSYGSGVLGGALWGVIAAIVLLLYGGIPSLFFFAIGESIYLFIDMEENTHISAQYLQYLAKQSQRSAANT